MNLPRTSQPNPGADTGGAPDEPAGFFYGWVVVGAVFCILVVSSGLGFYNASVILAAATDELDASVGSVSGATGLFFAIGGLSGFVLSRWMDTTDIRLFFIAGGVVGAGALTGLRWVDSVPDLYVFFALFGMGFGLAGLVPASTLVTRWFDHRRPVALSIASTGLSVGGIVLTPVSAWLIDRRGLSGAGSTLAVLWVLGIIPLAVVLLRSRPADKGLAPDGGPAVADVAVVETGAGETDAATPNAGLADDPGATFAEARRTRFYIAICLAYAAIFFGQVGAIAQLFKMVLERADVGTAGTALSMLALASVLARLVGGALVLRLPTKAFTATLAFVQAAGLAMLAVVVAPTSLVLSSAFLGVSIGNLLMLQPLLLAEAFGVRQYSRIYSFSQLFGTIGVAGGPLTLGVIRDQSDYRVAFLVAAAASLTGCLALLAAGPTERAQALWKPATTG